MKRVFLFINLLCFASVTHAQLYVSANATLFLNDNAIVCLPNTDLVNNGTISALTTGRFVFNGNGNNQISGTSAPNFAEMEIAKTSTGLLTLNNDINVFNKIIFTSNLIELNNHTIDLGSTGYLEDESEESRITGINGGEVVRTAVLNAPVGESPGYLGAVITSSQNLGNTIIRRGHKSQVNSNNTGSSIHRYFDIIPTNNTALNATLSIYYFDAEKNSLDENDFEVFKSEDNLHWLNVGHDSRNVGTNYVSKNGINSFSRWTLSTPASALPVTGLHLSGQWKNNAAYLEWLTQTENNNSHFNIERKYNSDLQFNTIGKKYSSHIDGNSQTPTIYHWEDADVKSNRGTVLYRIEQEDRDGKKSYSNIISVKPEGAVVFIQNLFPTLGVNGQVYLQTGRMDLSKIHVQIFDMNGRLMYNNELNYQSQWLLLPNMAAGTYKVFVSSGDNHWNGSFVKY